MTTEDRPLKRSAGIVIFHKKNDQCLFLLLRSYNYWDFPKGEVGPDEDPLQTAIREVEEETGIIQLDFFRGEIFYETNPYRTGRFQKIARYYIAKTNQKNIVMGTSPELGKPEHHEWRWVTIEEAKHLLNHRLMSVLEWAEVKGNCRTGSEIP